MGLKHEPASEPLHISVAEDLRVSGSEFRHRCAGFGFRVLGSGFGVHGLCFELVLCKISLDDFEAYGKKV